MNKSKKNAFHLLAIIFAFITIALNVFVVISLLTNLFGIKDLYAKILQEFSSYVVDVDSEVEFACFECGLNVLIHVIFVIRLIKLYTKAVPGVQLGRVLTNLSVWYLILTSISLPSLFALIAGLLMTSKANKPVIATAVPKEAAPTSEINEYKMKAMTEAVNRLKELRQSGAITEEEYYANLDKILEG